MTVAPITETSRFYSCYLERIKPRNSWEVLTYGAVHTSTFIRVIYHIALGIFSALAILLTMGLGAFLVAYIYKAIGDYNGRIHLTTKTVNLLNNIKTSSDAIPLANMTNYEIEKIETEITKLKDWEHAAPSGEQREDAICRVVTCWQNKVPTLNLIGLNLSSPPPFCDTLMSPLKEIDLGVGKIRNTSSRSLESNLSYYPYVVSAYCQIASLLYQWGLHRKVDHFQELLDRNDSPHELLKSLQRLATWAKEGPKYEEGYRTEAVKRLLNCWQTKADMLDFSDLNLSSFPPFPENTGNTHSLLTIDIGYAKITWPWEEWSRYKEYARDSDKVLKIVDTLRKLEMRGISTSLQSSLQAAYTGGVVFYHRVKDYTKSLEEGLSALTEWRDNSPEGECRKVACTRIMTAWKKNDEHLDLSNLKLTSLPPLKTLLSSLTILDIHGNRLSTLCKEALPPLSRLDISSNQFKNIPALNRQLKVLSVMDNPLINTSVTFSSLTVDVTSYYHDLTTFFTDSTTFDEPLAPGWIFKP